MEFAQITSLQTCNIKCLLSLSVNFRILARFSKVFVATYFKTQQQCDLNFYFKVYCFMNVFNINMYSQFSDIMLCNRFWYLTYSTVFVQLCKYKSFLQSYKTVRKSNAINGKVHFFQNHFLGESIYDIYIYINN